MANEFKIKNGLVVSGSADIEQDLTVRGKITADQLNISIVSSSVLYESGSTKFGDSIDDNHAFTGSINITGSINLNGQTLGTGKLDETTFNSFTSSYNTVSGSINNRLGSLESFSSSIDSNFVSEGEFGTHTGSLNSFTSSTLMTIGALNNESASIRGDFNSFTSSYTNVSTSLDIRLDTLETLSGSFTGSFSGSFKGDGTNLFNIPASGVTGLNLTQIADGFATASISSISGLTVNANTAISGNLIVSGNVTFGDTLYGTPEDAIFTASIKTHNTTYLGDMNTSMGDALIVSGAVKISGSQTIGNDLIVSGNAYFGDTLYGTPEDVIFTSSIKTHNTTYLGDMNTSMGDALIVSGAVKISGSQTISNDLIVSGNVYFGDTLYGTPEDVIFTSSIKTHNTTYLGDMNTSMGDALIVTGSVKINGHLSGSSLTGAIDYSNLTNVPTLVSSSSQIDITNTTNYTTFSSSISSSIGDISSSIATTTNDLDGRLDSIETTTSSLNLFTSSINTTIKSKLDSEGVISGSIQVNITGTTGYSTFSSSISSNISSSIGSLSGSIASTDNNQNTRLDNLETSTGSINTFTSSATGRLTSIETTTSSLNSFTSSIATTIKNKLNTEGVVSGSSQIDVTSTTNYTSFSSSIATTDLNQNNRLSSIEGKSGSYATTGSNTFVGSQTVSGSLIITQNLTVFGSSSITYVTSSQLRVDDNIITVNTSSPGQRFGGIEVYDSGSVIQATGSILWDSVNNRWIYQQSSEATYGGGVLMSGPRSSGSLGSELTLTSGRVAKSAGGDHLNDSNITDNGTTVSINSNTEITGSLLVTSTIVSQTTPLVSGSGQISFNGITDKPTLISGSSQVLNGSGIWSGSAQLPAGVVSGSSQVLAGTTIHSGSFFNGITVVSGSGQISFGGITGVPTGLVSGSSQVLSGTGIWSGSAQLPSGVVSGSSQVLNGSGIWSGSAQLPSGVVSGSAQIIAGLPSGTVSGSSQIAIASTTGFGTYINQAVLTTSSPTFSSVNATTFTGALSGNATTASSTPALTASGALTTQYGNGTIGYSYALTNPQTGLFTAIDNSNAIITINRHPGDYYSQLGFSSNGNLYYRSFSATAINTSQAWQTIWTNSTLTNNNQLSNGAGYLTSITSANVTTALGFTPYNATNPSGYITGITSTNVTTALGFTPYNATNPSGYITGISFANVSAKPTTISGYGITDAITTSNIASQSVSYASTAGSATTATSATSATYATNSSKLYSTDATYAYGGSSPYYGYLTYDGTYWQFKVSPATPANVRVYTADTLGGYSYSNSSGANTMVQRDSNGYIQNNYFYTSGGGSERNTSGISYLAGFNSSDYYIRSYTLQALGSAMSGVSMNISGTATNITAYTINQSVGSSNSPTFAGVTLSGPLYRNAAGTGYMNGNYSSVESPSSSGPIYSIGGSYVPTASTLGNMYGIGYLNLGGGSITMNGSSGWGMYVAANGTPYVFLGSEGNASVFRTTILPHANNTYNLGSASLGWANVYTNDLHLSNMNKPEGNDIDGTNGNWTIQEGEENLYIINNRNGKKFKISLEEIK